MRAIATLLILTTAVFAQESPWAVRELPAEESWRHSNANAINNRGEIVGDYSEPGFPNLVRRPILWRVDEPGWTDLATSIGLPANYTIGGAETISDTGLVGGVAAADDYETYPEIAVVWDLDAGTVRSVHPAGTGYNSSFIRRIRDDGAAVGMLRLFTPAFGGETAYFWGPGTLPGRVLPPLAGFDSSQVYGLNAAGRCVGYSREDGTQNTHATVWDPDGSITDLHAEIAAAVPDGDAALISWTHCNAILDDGTISGLARDAAYTIYYSWYRGADGQVHFLDTAGRARFITAGMRDRLRCGTLGVGNLVISEACLWVDGILHVLPPQDGFANRVLWDVNDAGVAAGDAFYTPNTSWWQGSRAIVVEPVADGDYDGDALKDKWELQGYEHDNGAQVDLFGMGANPLRRDLFVEIDAMAGHRPDTETLQPVIDAFNAHDIALHIHIDEDLPLDPNLGTLDGLGRYQWDEFDALKSAHFAEELESAVRYCVFAHRLATLTDSGLARGEPSSDFIVSLGAFVEASGSTDPWMQAGTFMHELGHTLGLRHGGADVTIRKPNYLSVMNYDFQKQGLRIGGQDGHFDYSKVQLAELNENALVESAGLGVEPLVAGHQTLYRVVTLDPITFKTTVIAVWSGEVQGSIDWDGSGAINAGTVSADINGNGAMEVLASHHDWDALDFEGGTVGFGVGIPPPPPPPETEVVEELTVEEAKLIPPPPVEGLAGRAGRGSVRLSWTPVGPYGQGIYKVYRWSDTQGRTLVAETQASLISDRPGRGTFYYVVTVTDSVGAESLDSEKLTLRVR